MHLPLLLSLAAGVQEPAPAFEIRLEPRVELWCEVRHRAAGEGPVPEDDLAPAVRAARAVDACLRSRLVWSVLDAAALRVEGSDWPGEPVPVPERFVAEGRTEEELRARIEELYAALAPLAEEWSEREWPAREEELRAAAKRLEKTLDAEVLDDAHALLDRWLELPPPASPVPVFLVTRAGPPGGVTVRHPDGPRCIVAVEGRAESHLVEVVLHELVHAWDVLPSEEPGLLPSLNRALARAGVRDPRRRRDWSHTLHFLAAAEAVRAVIAPEHVDHGERAGVYERLGIVHAELAPLWRAYVEEESDRETLIGRVVEAAAPDDDR